MITSAVEHSPIARAAPMAMVIDSSIVMRRSRREENASRKIGWPPTRIAAIPITLKCGKRLPDAEPDSAGGERHQADPQQVP